jgi:hypothetical protein
VVRANQMTDWIYVIIALLGLFGFLGFMSLFPSAPSPQPTPVTDLLFKIGRWCLIPWVIVLALALLSQCTGGRDCSTIVAGTCSEY